MKIKIIAASIPFVATLFSCHNSATHTVSAIEDKSRKIIISQSDDVFCVARNGEKILEFKIGGNFGAVEVLDSSKQICNVTWNYGAGGVCSFVKVDDPADPPIVK